MTASTTHFEPLATYLEPHFGNIYGINFDQSEYIDEQVWTPELAEAVNQYVLHEVGDDDYARFLDELAFTVSIPDDSRETQASVIIDKAQPWEIAHAFHIAAVKAVPTLDQLIGHLDAWPSENDRYDVALWLEAHTDDKQREHLVMAVAEENFDLQKRLYQQAAYHIRLDADDIVSIDNPSELLTAWHHVVGPAPSDLTDTEWRLLVSVLPPRRGRYGYRAHSAFELSTLRQRFDGIRYQLATNIPWRWLPPRYGHHTVINHLYNRYKKNGLFARMLAAMEKDLGTTRLVEWLRSIKPPKHFGVHNYRVSDHIISSTEPSTTPVGAIPSIPIIRAWAKSHGYALGDRGRLPLGAIRKYQAAQRHGTPQGAHHA